MVMLQSSKLQFMFSCAQDNLMGSCQGSVRAGALDRECRWGYQGRFRVPGILTLIVSMAFLPSGVAYLPATRIHMNLVMCT